MTMDDLITRLEAWNDDDIELNIDLTIELTIELSIAIHRHLELSEEDFRNYVSSIKSCIALAETVLPGWFWRMSKFGDSVDDPFYVVQIIHPLKYRDVSSSTHQSLPRAFLIALLRAHAAQDKHHE